MNPVRWIKDLRYKLFYKLVMRPGADLVTMGDKCHWTISPQGLGPTSKVLSGGAGNDISFEKELIGNYGCHVVLVDPSPTGIAAVKREQLPETSLTFLPVGLADRDEMVVFQDPVDALEGSFIGTNSAASASPRFECKKLATLMREMNWMHIDLLKIDIEGFEFPVLKDLLQQQLDVRQICVEFHHGSAFTNSRGATARMILALKKAGYDLVHRVNWDHTFLRRQPRA